MKFDYSPFGVSDETVVTPEGKVIRKFVKPPEPKTIEEALRQPQSFTREYIIMTLKSKGVKIPSWLKT